MGEMGPWELRAFSSGAVNEVSTGRLALSLILEYKESIFRTVALMSTTNTVLGVQECLLHGYCCLEPEVLHYSSYVHVIYLKYSRVYLFLFLFTLGISFLCGLNFISEYVTY